VLKRGNRGKRQEKVSKPWNPTWTTTRVDPFWVDVSEEYGWQRHSLGEKKKLVLPRGGEGQKLQSRKKQKHQCVATKGKPYSEGKS